MSVLEQEIIKKFHQLDKTAQRRVRALIERESETDAETTVDETNSTEDHQSWVDFIDATYGSMADDPMDEIDNTHLPPPVRDDWALALLDK